jgi:hypothetical protein
MKPWDNRVMFAHDVERRHGIKLRDCPFCGSGSVGLFLSNAPHVTCTKCDADGPTVEGGSNFDLDARQHQAIRLWNERI